MLRVPPSEVGDTPYERVMGHAPHILEPWRRLEDAFFSKSILPADLLEEVRRTLARRHGCQYCQAKGGPPDDRRGALRTSLAVAFAERYAAGHKDIDGATVKTMREHFSDPELVELVAFIGFMWAGGTFGYILAIKPASAT